MKHSLEVCLIALTLAVVTPRIAAQSAAEIPMRRGVSVEMPVISNAVAVPDADREDALIVAVTQDGSVYFGVDPIRISALAKSVRNTLVHRKEKTLYIKADARTSYANVVSVLDAVHEAGVEGLTLLTVQRDSDAQAFPVPPKGMELRVVRRAGRH